MALKISLAEVSECAGKIRGCNEQMFNLLESMKREMNNTNTSWNSEGGETIRSRFNQFSARFETMKSTIDSYSRFLDRTVETYDNLETTIAGNASSVQV